MSSQAAWIALASAISSRTGRCVPAQALTADSSIAPILEHTPHLRSFSYICQSWQHARQDSFVPPHTTVCSCSILPAAGLGRVDWRFVSIEEPASQSLENYSVAPLTLSGLTDGGFKPSQLFLASVRMRQ